MSCEKHLVEGRYKDSIIRAGMASEKITLTICELEDLFISPSQKKRIETLFYEGYIEEEGKPDQLFQNPKSERLKQFFKSIL